MEEFKFNLKNVLKLDQSQLNNMAKHSFFGLDQNQQRPTLAADSEEYQDNEPAKRQNEGNDACNQQPLFQQNYSTCERNDRMGQSVGMFQINRNLSINNEGDILTTPAHLLQEYQFFPNFNSYIMQASYAYPSILPTKLLNFDSFQNAHAIRSIRLPHENQGQSPQMFEQPLQHDQNLLINQNYHPNSQVGNQSRGELANNMAAMTHPHNSEQIEKSVDMNLSKELDSESAHNYIKLFLDNQHSQIEQARVVRCSDSQTPSSEFSKAAQNNSHSINLSKVLDISLNNNYSSSSKYSFLDNRICLIDSSIKPEFMDNQSEIIGPSSNHSLFDDISPQIHHFKDKKSFFPEEQDDNGRHQFQINSPQNQIHVQSPCQINEKQFNEDSLIENDDHLPLALSSPLRQQHHINYQTSIQNSFQLPFSQENQILLKPIRNLRLPFNPQVSHDEQTFPPLNETNQVTDMGQSIVFQEEQIMERSNEIGQDKSQKTIKMVNKTKKIARQKKDVENKYRQSEHKNVFKNFGGTLLRFVMYNPHFQSRIRTEMFADDSSCKEFEEWLQQDARLANKTDFIRSWTTFKSDSDKVKHFKEVLKELSRDFFENFALIYLMNTSKISNFEIHLRSIYTYLAALNQPESLNRFKPTPLQMIK